MSGSSIPNQADYTDAGKDTYNLKNPALAKKYLAQSGYKGEPVVLLTDKDYAPMYNSALVMQQELAGGRHQRAAQGAGLADLGADGAEGRYRLELLLHRLGHAAGAWRAGHHAASCRARMQHTVRKANRTIRRC